MPMTLDPNSHLYGRQGFINMCSVPVQKNVLVMVLALIDRKHKMVLHMLLLPAFSLLMSTTPTQILELPLGFMHGLIA